MGEKLIEARYADRAEVKLPEPARIESGAPGGQACSPENTVRVGGARRAGGIALENPRISSLGEEDGIPTRGEKRGQATLSLRPALHLRR